MAMRNYRQEFVVFLEKAGVAAGTAWLLLLLMLL